MPSSTSASEKTFGRSALVAFLGALLVTLLPYEALVRAAERRWGLNPARIAPRQTGAPHIDMFLEDVAAGVQHRPLAGGTPRHGNGAAPAAIEPVAWPSHSIRLRHWLSAAMMEPLDSRS